jgi:hypothetical protein
MGYLRRPSLIIVFFVFVLMPIGFGQATVFVAARSEDYLAVAMDTRVTTRSALPFLPDHHSNMFCKIRPLSNRVTFFLTGLATLDEIDTMKIATDTYLHARDTRQPIGLRKLTSEFSKELATLFSERQLDYRYATIGVFAGTDFDGSLSVYEGYIVGEPLQHTFTSQVQQIAPYEGNVRYRASAHGDIMKEFLDKPTERANQLKRDFIFEYKDHIPTPTDDNADGAALIATAIVKGIIMWSGDEGVGGEVSTIILERGRGVRWFRQLSFCPAIPN